MSKRFLKILKGEKTDRPAFWFMRQAGRYLPEYMAKRKEAGSFLDLCYNPEFAIEVTHQPLRRNKMDAAILFSDILVIPHALGQNLAFQVGKGPVLTPVDTLDKLEALSIDNLHNHLSAVYQTVKGLSESLDDQTALIGFAGAPWTVATYMVQGHGSPDQAAARSWAYNDPIAFQKLIDLLVEATSAYLIAQVNHGAEALQIFDTWSGSLPEGEFEKWCIEPVRQIIQKIRAVHPDVPIIGFPKGAGPKYPNYIQQTGVTAVSIDTSMPLEWVRDHIQPLVPVQGSLDPLLLVAGGDRMEKEALRILDTLKDGGHIFNLGHGIVPQTPPEHVEQLSKIMRDYHY
jgi:uroporphyrinogen decarboxylase